MSRGEASLTGRLRYRTVKIRNSKGKRLFPNSKRSRIPSNAADRGVQDFHQVIGNHSLQRLLKPFSRPEATASQKPTAFTLLQTYSMIQPVLGLVVQRSPMTDEQSRIWNRRVVQRLEQVESALGNRPPDYDRAMRLLQETDRSMRELERTFNMATLLGIQHHIASARRDIFVRGRYVQIDLTSARFEVRRMISLRRLPPEQEALWNRSVIQVIQEALNIIDRQPEPDLYRAQDLIREAERNSRELSRVYNLNPRDLNRILNYLRSARDGLALRELGIRPRMATRLALMDARRLPSYQGAIR